MVAAARDARPPDTIDSAAPRSGAEVPLMARLKFRTRPQHEALHRRGALFLLMRLRLAPTAYRCILERFDAFLMAAETQVLAAADDWLAAAGFVRASRRPGLARDLAMLRDAGVPPTPDGGAAPLTLDVPAGPGAALGLLYVVEGSRLGGQVLARRVGRALPSGMDGATHFLGSPGLDVSEHWRHVGTVINTLGDDPEVSEEACLAAQMAFTRLSELFDEVP